MKHNQRQGRQACLFDPLPRVRLAPELRQAVLPALAALLAAVLRQPAATPREGGPHDGA